MKQLYAKERIPIKLDYLLILTVLLMIGTGFIAIYSAFNLINSNAPLSFLKQQMIWFLISIIAVGIIAYLGNDTIYDVSKILYWILLGLLLYLFLARILSIITGSATPLPFTRRTNGAFSWFYLPAGLGSLQPSEFIKIVLLLIGANIVQEHNALHNDSSFSTDIQLFKKLAIWIIPPTFLILLQPDTGVVMIIIISFFGLLFSSSIRKEWFLFLFGALVLVLVLFFYLYFFHVEVLLKFIEGYKIRRINAWFYPELYQANEGLQQFNSKLVLGASGWTGFGLQQYLINIPEAQTDLIFTVIGQTFGFVGTSFTILLCLALDLQFARIALRTTYSRDRYFICGMIAMILFQQFENIGMILGILPVTGITLPFISYGGSSLLSYMIVFGIILNTSIKEKSTRTYH